MSKSYRKTPICGNTKKNSEKKDKRLANRQYRKIVKSLLQIHDEDFPLMKEISHVWSFNKDGKQYFGNVDSPEYLKKLMRK